MKIALIQLNSTVGDIAGNGRKIIRSIQLAKDQGADLACFHELALLGYPPRDLLELSFVRSESEKWLAKIAKESKGIGVIVGTVEVNPDPVGKHLFNSAAWCEEGEVKCFSRKNLLPSYDVFDETRHFEPGRQKGVVEFRNHKWGVTICEDIWTDPDFWPRLPYPSDPVSELVDKGSDILVNLSASPYSMGKFNQRLDMLSRLASRRKVFVVYVNQVGGNDELIFDGGSMVINPEGKVLSIAPFFKEAITIVDLKAEARAKAELPGDFDLLEAALVCGLRDYVGKCGFKKVALGLSGGVDSSLVVYLAVKALGPENVLGLIMPSRYSSKGSWEDAKALAKNLKITTKVVPIQEVHRAYEKSFGKMFGKRKPDITEENIQARIRGNLLMAVSNKLGHLILTTGNKSEVAVGYATLYGDMSGGLAVISDLPKTVVYQLCRHINRKKEIIPESVLAKPPSAELKPNQKDQDSLPPYDILDAVLKAYVEELRSEEEIIEMGFKPNVVKKILNMIHKNEYKRRQAPPGLRVTSKAFGIGRRFPIACKI